MNAEVKRAWLEALRSGEYQQTQGRLQAFEEDNEPRYCCLGVLCDLHAKATDNDLWHDGYYDDDQSGLPAVVRNWAGLGQRYPWINNIDITYYNDGTDMHAADVIRPHTFTEIADLIEEYL